MVASKQIIPMQQAITISAAPIPNPSQVKSITAMSKVVAFSSILKSSSNDPTIRAGDAFFLMMYGYELGIPPVTALRTLHLIEGSPTVSGQAMLGLLRKAGVKVKIPNPADVTDSATVELRRPDDGPDEWYKATFTLEHAKTAQLDGRKVWGKYPAFMLIWRALSAAARFHCPDIIGGLYTTEEIVDQPNAAFNAEGDLLETITIEPTVDESPPEPTPEPVTDTWTEAERVAFISKWSAMDDQMMFTALGIKRFSELAGDPAAADAKINAWLKENTTQRSSNNTRAYLPDTEGKSPAAQGIAKRKIPYIRERTRYLYPNATSDHHHNKSIQALIQDCIITDKTAAEHDDQALLERRADTDRSTDIDDIFILLSGEGPVITEWGDWIDTGKSLEDAWSVITEANVRPEPDQEADHE